MNELGGPVIRGDAGPLSFLMEQAHLQTPVVFFSCSVSLFLSTYLSFSSLAAFSPPLSQFCISKAAAVYVGRSGGECRYQSFNFGLFLTDSSLSCLCVCVFPDDLLGKRRSFSPSSSSECPSDSKKSRSVSPKGKMMQFMCVLMTEL